ASGPYSVTVSASADSFATSQTFTWNVASPITLTQPANQTNSEGDTISLSLSASGGGTKTYSATGLPTGLKLNPSTGAITGTVGLGASTGGPYSVTVLAQDGTSSTSQTFTWTVTNPVVITVPA